MISGSGSTLFEELGLYYIGPVDGHNVDDLVAGQWGGTKGHWCHGGVVWAGTWRGAGSAGQWKGTLGNRGVWASGCS
jgi:hypothetical protein